MSRVFFLTLNLEPGGAERQLVNLVRAWPQKRECEVVLLERKGPWVRDVEARAILHTLSDHRPSGYVRTLAWTLARVGRLRTLIKREEPAVIVGFLWFPMMLAALATFWLRKRPTMVWSLQSDLERDFQLHRTGFLRRQLARWTLRRCDLVLPISEGLRERVQAFNGLSLAQVEVLPNSIDLALLDQVRPGERLAAAPVHIVSVGRLHPAKGFDVLLDAVAHVRSKGASVLCDIIGEGPERGRLEALARQLGLTGVVRLPGRAEDPYPLVAAADIYVSSSRWETFGISIVEAMAMGKAIVATATDGANEILREVEGQVLVPLDDAESLASAILRLATDESARSALASQSRQNALRYDAGRVAKRMDELLQQLGGLSAPDVPA